MEYSANRDALPARGLARIEQVAAYTAGIRWPLPKNPADRWPGLRPVILAIQRAIANGELFAVIDEEPSEPCDHWWRREQCGCPRPSRKERIRIPVSAAIDWHIGLERASAELYVAADGRQGDAWMDLEQAAAKRGVGDRQIRRLVENWPRLQVGKKKLVRWADVVRR